MSIKTRIAKALTGMAASVYASAGYHSPQAHVPATYYAPSTGGNSGEKWTNGLSRSGQVFNIDNFKMMLNSRRAFHDSLQGRGIVKRLTGSVVGTGLKFESSIKFEELGISPEEAQEIGAKMESSFALWANSKKSSRDGSMTFYQRQGLYFESQIRDGEVFPRFYYSGKRDLISPLQISFVDPTQIQGIGFTSTAGQFNYDDGITRSAQGEETAYKISVQDETNPYQQKIVTIPAKFTRSGRISMIHGFKPEYAGQKRGYSVIGHALQELQNIQDYSLTTLQRAISQASIFAFTKPSNNAPASNPQEGLISNMAAGQRASQTEVANAQDPYSRNVCQVPEAIISQPGSVFLSSLAAGEDIEFPAMSAPADKYGEYLDANMAYLAPSCGIPLEVLKMLWGTSFSASRATLIEYHNETVMPWRDEVSADFLNPSVEAFFSEEIAAGRLQLPGWSDPRLRAAWLNCNWIGQGVPDIDPGKTAKARKDNLEMGLTTGQRESRNLNGSDFDQNVARNKKAWEDWEPAPWSSNFGVPEEIETTNMDEENG